MTQEHEVNSQDIGEQGDMGPDFALTPALFGKYSYENIETNDISLQRYLQVKDVKAQVFVPYTAGRYQKRRFKKATCPIVERFTTMLMIAGARTNGKKHSCPSLRTNYGPHPPHDR